MEQRIASSDIAAPAASESQAGLLAKTGAFASQLLRKTWSVLQRSWLQANAARGSLQQRLDAAARSLDVERRGCVDGMSNYPASTEQRLSGMQREIVTYCKGLHRKAVEQFSRSIERIRRQSESIGLSETARMLGELPSRCENQILRLNAELGSQASALQEAEKHHRQSYASFREANGLSRTAGYPRTRLVHLALAAVLVGSATVFLRRALPQADGATLSADTIAASMALICVLVPFGVATTAFRHTHHVRGSNRFFGWVATMIAVAFVAGAAFFAAMYRTLPAGDTVAEFRSAIEAILADPTSISLGPQAWLILLALLGVALLAFLVGYKSDDPYPSYGAVQRAYYKARRDSDGLSGKLRRQVNEIIDGANNEALQASAELESERRRLGSALERSRRDLATASRSIEESEEVCNALLEMYRDINTDARETDIPECFSEYVSFRKDVDSLDQQLADAQGGAEQLIAQTREVDDRISKVMQELKDLNWNAISGLVREAEAENAE
jgi:uncharacterized coiled-coil DUF342 family protein